MSLARSLDDKNAPTLFADDLLGFFEERASNSHLLHRWIDYDPVQVKNPVGQRPWTETRKTKHLLTFFIHIKSVPAGFPAKLQMLLPDISDTLHFFSIKHVRFGRDLVDLAPI